MSPQTEIVYHKTGTRIDRIEGLTSDGAGHRQQVWFTREQIRRPLQDVDSLLLGQPPLRMEMTPYEIEVWYRGPIAIVGEKLFVLGSVGGWMGYVLCLAFREFRFIFLE